jgi:hypothetical protein
MVPEARLLYPQTITLASCWLFNLLENIERTLWLRLLMALADNYGIDWRDIVADKTANLLAELRSVIKDPMFSATPDLTELRGAIDLAPRLVESGAVYLVSSGLMSACEFRSKLGSRDMNERDAFGWAVRSLRLYDWNPAVPDKPRFQVNGDSLTFREICERAKKLDEPLPEVIKYDLYPLLGRAPDLQAKLRLNETYSVAATCLLEFLTGRERN